MRQILHGGEGWQNNVIAFGVIMQTQSIWLNQEVYVKLTDDGKKIYNNHFIDFVSNVDHVKTKKEMMDYAMNKIKDGTLTCLLWELFDIFGLNMCNGCDFPFVDGIIEYKILE